MQNLFQFIQPCVCAKSPRLKWRVGAIITVISILMAPSLLTPATLGHHFESTILVRCIFMCIILVQTVGSVINGCLLFRCFFGFYLLVKSAVHKPSQSISRDLSFQEGLWSHVPPLTISASITNAVMLSRPPLSNARSIKASAAFSKELFCKLS